MSCHAILEYDELKILEELNIPYFSLGSYVIPTRPVDRIRPALKYQPPDKMYEKPLPDKNELTEEFLEPFDTIIVMHVPDWIEKNWELIKHKRVIWRTIGQSTPKIERKLMPFREQGLEVIRYSHREVNIEGNIGADGMIRFYKDPNEFNHWSGGGTEVATFAQNFKHRGEHLNFKAFNKLTFGFNAKVYGPKNEDMGDMNGGYQTYDQMKQKLRDLRAYVYTGTQPASYTLSFIEAMMTGTPMVCLGAKHANSMDIGDDLYEVPDIIQNGYNGYVSDDIQELRYAIEKLTTDKHHATEISRMGRITAMELFSKEIIKQQWERYLCR